MRETFPREAAEHPEPFTGERLTASIHGQVEIEHYHRYLFSRNFCRDRDVLDVASGEGYGTAQLAQVARRVVGVEYAGATARNAAANFSRDNLSFVRGDARTLPLGDSCVDVVTSFETIEHFDRQEDFVTEVRRVLRSDGCFIVSTPDREIYSPPGAPPNPFHVREFNRAEFLDLLHRHFRYVSLVRQRPMLASCLMPEESAAISPWIFERTGECSFLADTTLPKAPYLIAIASELAPRLAPMSLLLETSDIDSVRLESQQAEIGRMRAEVGQALAEAAASRVAEEAARAAVREAEEAARVAVRAAQEEARKAGHDAEEAARAAMEAARDAARVAVHEAEEAARVAVETAEARAERFESDAKAAAVTLTHTRAALVQANNELDRLSGSFRQFIRQYVPRAWRHISQ